MKTVFLFLLVAWALPSVATIDFMPRGTVKRKNIHVVKQDGPPLLPHRGREDRPFAVIRQYKEFTAESRLEGKVINVYTAHLDADGFRITPGEDEKKTVDRHLIFGGCSWTFGMGVEDTEPFPALVSRGNPTTQVLNLGLNGGSSNEQNFIWQFGDFRPRVRARKGIFVYTYGTFQHERFQRVPQYYAWGGDSPSCREITI